MNVFAFAMPGPIELAIIAGVVTLLFGAQALPKLARNAGKVLPSFKAGMREVEKEAEILRKEADEIKQIGNNISRDLEKAVK